MRPHLFPVYVLIACVLLSGSRLSQAQVSANPSPPSSSQPQPEAVATRKAEVEQQLKALAESKRPESEIQAERMRLERLLTTLTALEAAWRRRDTAIMQLQALPQRLRDLEAARQRLETQPPARFPVVTEALRDEYATKLQAVQDEMQQLTQQISTGEKRLAAIPAELEQLATEIVRTETALRAAKEKATADPVNSAVELLQWRLQLLHAEREALTAERDWLTKRGPLDDALLHMAQLREQILQRDIDTLQQRLETTLKREEHRLRHTTADLERQLAQATAPADRLRLEVELETRRIQHETAAYRQQHNQLSEALQAQQQQLARDKQRTDRFMAVVTKHTQGNGVGPRVLRIFNYLKQRRLQQTVMPVRAARQRLHVLTGQLAAVDDRLFDFEDFVATRMAALATAMAGLPPEQHEAAAAQLRQALAEQRLALREQQQVLATLVQDQTALLDGHRQSKQLIEETYRFVLTQLFWLRDAKSIDGDVLADGLTGMQHTLRRFGALGQAIIATIRNQPGGSLWLGVGFLLVIVVLPGAAWWGSRHLRRQAMSALETAAAHEQESGTGALVLLLVQAAVWPVYLLLLAWGLQMLLPQLSAHRELALALMQGLRMAALVLGGGLFALALFQHGGWAQRYWHASPELCRFLRLLVLVGLVATLVLLLPHQLLRAAPGVGESTAGSLALARVCFLMFQVVVLVLVGLAGSTRSPLILAVLADSRQREGLLWRLWPFLYLLVVVAIVGNIALNVLGYRYAAQSIWFNALESLFVVVLLRVLLVLLFLRLAYGLLQGVLRRGGRVPQRYPGFEATMDRVGRVIKPMGQAILWLLAVALVLEVWNVSIFRFLRSPTGSLVLGRVLLAALTVGGAVALIRLSKAIVDFLLQPRATAQGGVHEPSAKLRTLAPLIQTVMRIGVVVVAALILLEIVGIATGPFLAGLGIFGLAVGLASQSLIRDVINGLFILFEDSIAVGNIAILNGQGGQVERITLRTVTLRGLDGTVYVIPNSSIGMVANMTKGFSRYVLDIRLSLQEDIDKVITILRLSDPDMRREPEFGNDMLGPLEIMGLDRFEASNLIIRARMQTKPIQQWRLGREFNRRLKAAFEAHGIRMPVPHRMLQWEYQQQGAPEALRPAPDAGTHP